MEKINLDSLCMAPYLSHITELKLIFNSLETVGSYYDILASLGVMLSNMPLLENLNIVILSRDGNDVLFVNTTEVTIVKWNLPSVKILKLIMGVIPRLNTPLLRSADIRNIREIDIPHVLLDTCHASQLYMAVNKDVSSLMTDDDYSNIILLNDETKLSVTEFQCSNFPTRLIPLLSQMKLLKTINLCNMVIPSYEIVGRLLQSWPMIQHINIQSINVIPSVEPLLLPWPTSCSTEDNSIRLPELVSMTLSGWNQKLIDSIICPKLTTLEISNGKSPGANEMKEECVVLTRFFNHNPLLENVVLSCPFQFASLLVEPLNDLRSLKLLSIESDDITHYSLATFLSNVPNIVMLTLFHIEIPTIEILNLLAGTLPSTMKILNLQEAEFISSSYEIEELMCVIRRFDSLSIFEVYVDLLQDLRNELKTAILNQHPNCTVVLYPSDI
jgi:hypothetical protein